MNKNYIDGNGVTKYIGLILIAVLANSVGMFSPVLSSNDAYFYSIISKNILTTHDWIGLFYQGQDWLDKPHFPFWMTALSFKFFGVNVFAFVLPGFIFNIIGAIYTYRLAKEFFDFDTAILSALIYVTSLHLMISAIDIRAEAFLVGQIIPACFYLWRFTSTSRFKHLVLASLFTGLALMTKGLFVLVTICSGQVIYLIYVRKLNFTFINKFLIYLFLSFVFALPEFICLYLQFDMHPEKVVFGKTGVSGIEWYFWGSQFGRFFNTGPIVNTHGDKFFFVHTFLWSFLPWSLLFIFAMYYFIKNRKIIISYDFSKFVYLMAAFIPTFVMFSLTKFQLDYYTNIIIPFAAILCAALLINYDLPKWFLKVQTGLNIIILLIGIVLTLLVFKLSLYSLYSLYAIMPLFFLLLMIKSSRKNINKDSVITFASIAISNVFIILMLIYRTIYPTFATGLNLADYFSENKTNNKVVYLINTDKTVNIFRFHKNGIEPQVVDSVGEIKDQSYYVLVDKHMDEQVKALPDSKLLQVFPDIAMEKFIPTLLSSKKYQQDLRYYELYKVH